MRYIRTKNGKIIDLQKFIEEEKENPYYTDYKFEEIKNKEDYCYIHWTAIGTEKCSIKDQVGRRCQFGATVDSPFIKQADTIEELCDEVVFFDKDNKPHYKSQGAIWWLGASLYTETLRFGIWTDKGLIYVAKMNDKGELELL